MNQWQGDLPEAVSWLEILNPIGLNPAKRICPDGPSSEKIVPTYPPHLSVARVHKVVARLALAVALVVIVGACKKPPVTGIEIVPSKVIAGAHPMNPTTFELEARLWTGPATDRLSIIESDGYDNLHWKSSKPWLTVVSRNGFRAVLRIEPNAAPTGSAFVTVEAGGKKTEPGAEISVAPSGIVGQDVLTATYVADKAPNMAVVHGIRDGGPCSVSVSAFVTRLPMGTVKPCGGDAPAWGGAVLAVDQRVAFTPAWTTNPDAVDAIPLQGSLRSLPLALRVMVWDGSLGPSELATLRDDVLEMANADIAVANSILAEARTGITLTFQDPTKVPVLASTVVGDCRSGDDETSGNDLAAVLNVYYVNGLAGYRGLTCDRQDTRHHVIYVGWDQHSPTTFVHEIGHALGLTLPGAGHTDMVSGLDGTNIMATGEDDRDPGGRRRLSVGQAFRMQADSVSWLSWATTNPPRPAAAPHLGCQCGETDPSGHCPRVVEEVDSPSEVPGTAWAWDCFDQLRLTQRLGADESLTQELEADESPVAIVAGRRWRAPPGTCRTDLPGRTERHWDATYIRFDNLTRPGTCTSWAAIFFLNHGVLYRPLAEPEFAWTQTADLFTVSERIPPPIEVRVHVHGPASQAIRDQDRDHALETFGPGNRSGIVLKFIDSAACPTAPTEIHICYVLIGGTEAIRSGNRIRVSLPKRTGTTVSHFLGQALGLPDAAPADHRAYSDNIMQSDPAKRKKKLTLGQVFRINGPLNASLPVCGPGRCPPLSADVTP